MEDELFDALQDAQRRQILLTLLNDRPQDGSIRAEFPWDTSEDTIRKQHIHLPKLADYGFVEWNEDADIVTRGPRFNEVSPFLKLWQERKGNTASD